MLGGGAFGLQLLLADAEDAAEGDHARDIFVAGEREAFHAAADLGEHLAESAGLEAGHLARDFHQRALKLALATTASPFLAAAAAVWVITVEPAKTAAAGGYEASLGDQIRGLDEIWGARCARSLLLCGHVVLSMCCINSPGTKLGKLYQLPMTNSKKCD